MRFDFFLAGVRQPVKVEYRPKLVSSRGVLGYVTQVRDSDSGSYVVVLDSILRRPNYRLLLYATLIHELAHIRYGSLSDANVIAKRARIRNFWERECGAHWANAYSLVYNLLEDLRVSYMLLDEFPGLVNYVALLNNIILPRTEVSASQNALDALFVFLRNGKTYPQFEDLYDYVWWRAYLIRRSKSVLDSVALAHELTVALALKWNAASFLDYKLASNLLRLLSSKNVGKRKNPSVLKIMPWGATHVENLNDFVKEVREGGTEKLYRELRYGKAQSKNGGASAGGGGVGISDRMRVLEGTSYVSVLGELEKRRDEYDELRRILSDLRTTPAYVSAREGEINVKRLASAYVSSFVPEEGRDFLKKSKNSVKGDVAIILDTSGSMYGVIKKSWSDSVLLFCAMNELGFRTAYGCVADDFVMSKDFVETFDGYVVRPKSDGFTNFHLFFGRHLERMAWENDVRVVVLFTDGLWPYISRETLEKMRNYKIVACLPSYQSPHGLPEVVRSVKTVKEAAECIVHMVSG